MLAVMSEAIEQIEADLVERVGGSRLLEGPGRRRGLRADDDDEAEDEDTPGRDRRLRQGGAQPWRSAERVLAQLNADCPGSVSPESPRASAATTSS